MMRSRRHVFHPLIVILNIYLGIEVLFQLLLRFCLLLVEANQVLGKKLRKKEYKGIEGRQLDELWTSISALSSESK